MSNHVAKQDSCTGQGTDSVDAEELVSRFRDGDARAFDDLVRMFQSRIFNLAFRMLNNYEEATELTQDVFVKVYRSIGMFRGRSRFSTWLYSVASNACRNRMRQMRRISHFEALSLDDTAKAGEKQAVSANEPDPSGAVEQSEIMRLVQDSVAALPQEFGTVAIMRDIQGMSYEEIAAALNCSMGTVKSRISRARAMIKEKLQQAGVTV